jgi:outer membrane protein TolC
MLTKLLNKIIITIFLPVLGFPAIELHAQLTIEDCQTKAKANYPLIRRYDLIEKSKKYSLSNVAKSYFPQFQINARASYQSDVTTIPLSLPGINIPTLSKNQYQTYLEATQILWDGGLNRSQKEIVIAAAEVEKQQLQTDLYAVESRVNHLFFGILLLDAQLEQNQILQDDLGRNHTAVTAYLEYGIANQVDLDAVKVEQLNACQVAAQLQSMRLAYFEMLSYMIGDTLNTGTTLVKPEAKQLTYPNTVHRPELRWMDAQKHLLESQKNLVKTSYLPKLNLFLQGGAGRPGLNMLSSDFNAYYIGGIRLTWNFGSLYTRKNDLRKLEINQYSVDAQRETFLYNLNLAITSEDRDIQRLREQMKYDDEIIALRKNIRQSAEAKLANGTLTTADLLREINRENLARQAKVSHEIELLIAIYKYYNQLGISEL